MQFFKGREEERKMLAILFPERKLFLNATLNLENVVNTSLSIPKIKNKKTLPENKGEFQNQTMCSYNKNLQLAESNFSRDREYEMRSPKHEEETKKWPRLIPISSSSYSD